MEWMKFLIRIQQTRQLHSTSFDGLLDQINVANFLLPIWILYSYLRVCLLFVFFFIYKKNEYSVIEMNISFRVGWIVFAVSESEFQWRYSTIHPRYYMIFMIIMHVDTEPNAMNKKLFRETINEIKHVMHEDFMFNALLNLAL